MGGAPSPVNYSSFVPGHKLIEAEMCLAMEQQKQRNFCFKSIIKEKNSNILYETINIHFIPIYFSNMTCNLHPVHSKQP